MTLEVIITLSFEELEVALQGISTHHQLCYRVGDVDSCNKAAALAHRLMEPYRAMKLEREQLNEAAQVAKEMM